MWNSNTLPAIFRHIPPDLLHDAQRCFRALDVDEGIPLIQEGDQDPTLVVVEAGELEVSTGGTRLAWINPGDMLGEIALFSGLPRTADVRTVTSCRLLVLDVEGYEALRNTGHPLAHAIEENALHVLVERLGNLNRRIAELAQTTDHTHELPSPGFFDKVASALGSGGIMFPGSLNGLAVLRASPLFEGVPDEVLELVASEFWPMAARRGQFLCTEGETGNDMYILAGGKVDVIVATGDKMELLATLGPGEAFGMCSLVHPDLPRMASCVAREKVTALSIGKIGYAELVHRPDIVGSVMRVAMIRAIADQVSYANGQLARLDMEEQLKQAEADALYLAGAALEAHGQTIGTPSQEQGRAGGRPAIAMPNPDFVPY